MSTDQVIATVALVGSPNSGKTTLFNWLTGSRFKTVNYAGSTVDTHKGKSLGIYGEAMEVLDTPGIYSLQPHGRDEEVTLETLMTYPTLGAVVVVVDGTQLNRQLYLVRQIQELGLPMVLAVTMMDLVKQVGRRLDLNKLGELVEAPVVAVDGRLGGGVADVLNAVRSLALNRLGRWPSGRRTIDWDDSRIEKEIAVVEGWTHEVVEKAPNQESLDRLRRLDRVFLHPVWGVVAFWLIMGAVFSSVFWLAAPMMDVIDSGFSALSAAIRAWLGPGLPGDFLADGIIAGVGSVMVFVPQIFVLFLGLTLLEDSGYLARAATIIDRPLHKLGLSGRSFVPILSGFACAVPAIMATRNIRSGRERWITVFILPFMTCSARLPVYALLLTFLFARQEPWRAGLALTALYLGGVLIGGLAAGLLNRVLKKTGESHLLMELPVYRWPKPGFTLQMVLRRTRAYVWRAGPTIFVFTLLLWIGTHWPYRGELSHGEQLAQSLIGLVGHAVEPAFELMGLDWRVGLGMMSAFVAREVFVSSLAVIFNLAGAEGDSMREGLIENMRRSLGPDGQPLFTAASVTGLLVFFMIALQCLSTTGVTWRETGSAKYALVQLVALNILAYVLAVATVQTLRLLGVA
jgi:ferrous iron transport protein B